MMVGSELGTAAFHASRTTATSRSMIAHKRPRVPGVSDLDAQVLEEMMAISLAYMRNTYPH